MIYIVAEKEFANNKNTFKNIFIWKFDKVNLKNHFIEKQTLFSDSYKHILQIESRY